MKNFLFLFDIDGTILDSGGFGKKAFIEAFSEVSRTRVSDDINFTGGIDNILFKDLYYKYNLSSMDYDKTINKFKKIYFKILKKYSLSEEWHIYPNVYNTIKALSKNSNIALATGNFSKGAKIKLDKFDLFHFFSCGGYGDKSKLRREFVYDAIKLSKKIFKKDFKNNEIYLFGDTEKDVISAVENNIIPVYIDHKKNYLNGFKLNECRFYGTFQNIDKFIDKINSNNKDDNIFFF